MFLTYKVFFPSEGAVVGTPQAGKRFYCPDNGFVCGIEHL